MKWLARGHIYQQWQVRVLNLLEVKLMGFPLHHSPLLQSGLDVCAWGPISHCYSRQDRNRDLVGRLCVCKYAWRSLQSSPGSQETWTWDLALVRLTLKSQAGDFPSWCLSLLFRLQGTIIPTFPSEGFAMGIKCSAMRRAVEMQPVHETLLGIQLRGKLDTWNISSLDDMIHFATYSWICCHLAQSEAMRTLTPSRGEGLSFCSFPCWRTS